MRSDVADSDTEATLQVGWSLEIVRSEPYPITPTAPAFYLQTVSGIGLVKVMWS